MKTCKKSYAWSAAALCVLWLGAANAQTRTGTETQGTLDQGQTGGTQQMKPRGTRMQGQNGVGAGMRNDRQGAGTMNQEGGTMNGASAPGQAAGQPSKEDRAKQELSRLEQQGTALGDQGNVMARAEEISNVALMHIAGAMQALQEENTDQAKSALGAAKKELDRLYDAVPVVGSMTSGENQQARNGQGKQGQQRMPKNGQTPGQGEQGTAAQNPQTFVVPVTAEIENQSVYMDPRVAAGFEKAAQSMQKGDQQAAQKQMQLAYQQLVADIALLPIEEAYARVSAAQQELNEGNTQRALRMLQQVPVITEQIRISAPLVPVRFNLRAAALAAQHGQWDTAQTLVNDATQILTRVEGSDATTQQLQQQLRPMLQQAQRLQKQMEQGKKPQPSALRQLANQTQNIGTM